MRDHEPVLINEFFGLYDRGDKEECPLNHFTECNNIRFVGSSAFGTRFGIGLHQNVEAPLGNIVRLYNYVTPDGSTLLALTWDGTDGSIYHVIDSTTMFGPILTIAGMEDFGFVAYAGRAYITPFASFTQGALWIEKGLQNEFLYVYEGDGSPARKAGGAAPSGTITVANGAAGHTDAGIHLFGVVFETDTGYLSAPAAFNNFTTSAALSVSFSSVPISGDSFVTKRHIVATKKITTYNGNTTGYTYYFIPDATINDNVTTTLPNISFYDADLLDDASHLLDNYDEIPAGVNLFLYHNRLCLSTTFDDISITLVSAQGEPEAFSRLDGFVIFPPDGNPITNGFEMRDVMYLTKRARTVSFVDNDDAPSSWPLTVVDDALGAPVHGIATVIDSGSSSSDQSLVATLKGIHVFNGTYPDTELTWKIQNFWFNLDKIEFRHIQMLNDPINQIIYLTLPDYTMLIGDYRNGITPQDIRWTPWSFDIRINTIALVNINELIFGAETSR